MKNLLTTLIAICFTVVLSSQVPEKMSYQAVIRDASGQLVTTQIRIQISIFKENSDVGFYSETQTPTPNANGLITIEIGGDDPEAFADIDWSNGPYSITTSIDPTGGTNYTINGTSQILSVPYALHAKTAEMTTGDSIWRKSTNDIYYNNGNVGLGTDNPQYPLHIVSKSVNGSETLFQASVADDPNSFFEIGNSTNTDGRFMPAIISHNATTSRQSLFVVAKTTDELDDMGGYPLITFDARRMEGPIINRPLFQWSSYGDIKMTMLANGNVGIGVTDPGNFGLSVSDYKDVRFGHYINIADYDHEDTDAQLISRDGNLYVWTGGLVLGRYANGLLPSIGYGNLKVQNNIVVDGSIGIGKNPDYKLDVNGTITSRSLNAFRFRYNNNGAFFRMDETTLWLLLTDIGDPDGTFNSYRPFSVNLSSGLVGLNQGLFVNSSGNVGIGKSAPSSKLHTTGSIRFEGLAGTGSRMVVASADGTLSTLDGIATPVHTIGESYGGGIIFYLDASGKHGLIAATADQSTGVVWTNTAFQSTVSNAVRDGINGGLANTERIIIQAGAGSYAAQICANYQGGNYGDWYLPSKYELNLLYLQKDVVGGFANAIYWSSTEVNYYGAWRQYIGSGSQLLNNKGTTNYVRAVRAF